MSQLEILHEPHPLLRKKCLKIEVFDETLRKEAQDMIDTLEAAEGLGLAAPQVGILKRLIIYDLKNLGLRDTEKIDTQIKDRFLVMINPEILSTSDEEVYFAEPCFSLPTVSVDVKRPESLELRFQDQHGQPQKLKASGLFARCIQHEIDHLDGILAIDYLSPLKNKFAVKKLEKISRNKGL